MVRHVYDMMIQYPYNTQILFGISLSSISSADKCALPVSHSRDVVKLVLVTVVIRFGSVRLTD